MLLGGEGMKNKKLSAKLTALFLSFCVLFAAFPAAGFSASAESLPKIWLDAGHGGSDPGATNGDRHEADDNLRVAIAVGAKLEAIGFEVGYTRKTDVAVELGDRVPMASDFGADFVISFHRNSATPAATGLETYYHFKENTDSAAYKLASALQQGVLGVTGYANRGTKADGDPNAGDIGLRITRNSWERGIAGALIEVGFIRNDGDNAVFDENFDAMVTALASAISECAGGGEVSNAVKPYEKDGDLHLTDCDSTDGFWTANGTEVSVQDENGRKSIHMRNFTSYKDHPAGVGAMAFLDFDPGCAADISAYNKLHFSLWSSYDYANDDERGIDVFQLNLVTRTDDGAGIEQDGYNIIINAWNIEKGWNDCVVDLEKLAPAVETADKTKIHRLRFTWFNNSNGDRVEFNIDDVYCYSAPDPALLCSCEKDTEDVFDFCGNAHSSADGALTVDGQTAGGTFPGNENLVSSFYARVGRNYGDADYTRSFDYTRYYQFEVLVKPETNNTLVITHGNEQNNMEWQFKSSTKVMEGKWDRVEILISDIEKTAVQGDAEIGLDNVNLLHFGQTEKGAVSYKNMALITKEYANARQNALYNFYAAVDSIGNVTINSIDDISYANAMRTEAEKFINVETALFESYCDFLDRATDRYNLLAETVKGDVNLDGEIKVEDALLALQAAVGKIELDYVNFYAADIGDKESVTVKDALLILQVSVGKIPQSDLVTKSETHEN